MPGSYVLVGPTWDSRVSRVLGSGSVREHGCEPNDDETNSDIESICQTIFRRDSQQRMLPRVPSQRRNFLPLLAGVDAIRTAWQHTDHGRAGGAASVAAGLTPSHGRRATTTMASGAAASRCSATSTRPAPVSQARSCAVE